MNPPTWAVALGVLSAVLLWLLVKAWQRLRVSGRTVRDFRRELSKLDARVHGLKSQVRKERERTGLERQRVRLFQAAGLENARKARVLREKNALLTHENEKLMTQVERLALEATRLPSPESLDVELRQLVAGEQDR